MWELGLGPVWELGLGTILETGLKVYWSFIWMKRTINLRNIIEKNLCIFFNFLPSKTKRFNNHSYEWRRFWLERWKIFYSQILMTHICMTWYDVSNTLYINFSFYILFENKFELIPISLLFWIYGIILLWYFFTFSNHLFGLISLLTNTLFNQFF